MVMLEITPRGAFFTLPALSHVGHPAHLALIDAYLKGQVRLTPTTGIGEDSRIVAASLAAPLLAAHEHGVERLTLADLVLLPPEDSQAGAADRAADGHPVSTADSARFLLRAHGEWHRIRAAERFEAPGCLGTKLVGQADPWRHVIGELHEDGRILAEARARSETDEAVASVDISRLRAKALARFARAPLDVSSMLTAEPDGYRTLCLLPPPDADPATVFEAMRARAWEEIERLIGRLLPEHRTEPIELRLIGEDRRTTTLDIGASVVIVRNQTVFAAWVGSDGRVMIRLSPRTP